MRMLETVTARSTQSEKTIVAAPARDAFRLAMLISEHDDLDCAISALLAAGNCDDLLIRRLKKHKLHLKDAIAQILPHPDMLSIAG